MANVLGEEPSGAASDGRSMTRAGSIESLRASKRKDDRDKDGGDDATEWSAARRLLFRGDGTRFTKQLRRDGRASFCSGPFETPRKGVVDEAADGLVAQWKNPRQQECSAVGCGRREGVEEEVVLIVRILARGVLQT